MSRTTATLILFTLSMSSSALVTAQTNPSPLADIYACAEISDPIARLACYDSKVPIVKKREAAQEIVALDREQVKEERKRSFGLPTPNFAKVFGDKNAKDDDPVVLEVLEVIQKRGRPTYFRLENDQLWVRGDSKKVRYPKSGLTAEIVPASLGSFMMTLKTPTGTMIGIRVKRIE